CNFGWDWSPVLVTSGIWKGVMLEGWSVARIARVIPRVVFADHDHASVKVRVDLRGGNRSEEKFPRGEFKVALLDPDGVEIANITKGFDSEPGAFDRHLEVESPSLWWPIGHGE